MRPLQNDWAAYQFDAAVLYVGLTIENAIQEREESPMGHPPSNARESRPRYTLEKLLDADFRLQRNGSVQGGLKQMVAAHPDMVGRWKQAPREV